MSLSDDLTRRLEVALASPSARDELLGHFGITTFGTVYYVNANSDEGASDFNDGLSMSHAFATVAKAHTVMVSGADDYCLMSGNTEHTISTELTMVKNRMHFLGLGGPLRMQGQRTRWEMGVTTGSEIGVVQNTGNGNTFHNIKMRSIDTNTSSLYVFADGGEHTVLDHVALEHDALLSTALCHELLANGDTCEYRYSTIGNLIYETAHATRCPIGFKRETISGKVCRDVKFIGCDILVKAGLTTSVHCNIVNATDIERRVVFDNCDFISAKLGANTQSRVFNIDAAQTEGEILLRGGTAVWNVAEIADTGEGVFTDHPDAVKDGPEGIVVAVS